LPCEYKDSLKGLAGKVSLHLFNSFRNQRRYLITGLIASFEIFDEQPLSVTKPLLGSSPLIKNAPFVIGAPLINTEPIIDRF